MGRHGSSRVQPARLLMVDQSLCPLVLIVDAKGGIELATKLHPTDALALIDHVRARFAEDHGL